MVQDLDGCGSGPEVIPAVVGAEDTQLGDGICVRVEPCGSGLFQTGLEDVLMAGLDHAAADGEFTGEGVGVVQCIAAVIQIAIGGADWRRFLGLRRRFQMRLQFLEKEREGSALEALLLSPQPGVRR